MNAAYRRYRAAASHQDRAIRHCGFCVGKVPLIFYPPALEVPGSRWREEIQARGAATLREPG